MAPFARAWSLTGQLLSFLVGALVVVSCTVSPEVVLYNNAGFSVELQFHDRRIELRPGARVRFNSSTLWNQRLVIVGGMRPVSYQPPPGEFPSAWLRSGFLNSYIVAQLEPDLALYLLAPALDPPQPNTVEQPPGFPLRPRLVAGAVAA
jgi:hypothetical protein